MNEEGKEKEDEEAEGFEDNSEVLSEEDTPSFETDISENVIVSESFDDEKTEMTEEDSIPLNDANELRAEIERLRGELDKRDKENARMVAEIGEFSAVFPETSLERVPSEVWQSVKAGVPLAAAYALYEKKSAAYQKFTQSVNQKNYEQSSGAVGKERDSIYYSPSEVKKMSPAEVRANYTQIINSMSKWH